MSWILEEQKNIRRVKIKKEAVLLSPSYPNSIDS